MMADNPAPPYEGYDIPTRFREMAWEDLPPAIQQKIRKQQPQEPPS